MAVEIITQPFAETVRVLAAIEVFTHGIERVIFARRPPCGVIRGIAVRINARNDPAARPFAQVCFIIALKLRVAHQPVGGNPLAIIRHVDIAAFGHLFERRDVAHRILRLGVAKNQIGANRRNDDDEQRRRQRLAPRAEEPAAEQNQQRKPRRDEEKEEAEDQQVAGVFVRQRGVPAPRHRGQPDEDRRR